MKGLLWKEYYMVLKYCRWSIVISAVFIVVSAFSDNFFYLFYPMVLGCMIPMTLLSYEEQCNWKQYSAAFPYSRAELVSSKYAVALFFTLLTSGCSTGAAWIRIRVMGTGDSWGSLLVVFALLFVLGVASASFTLPFLFQFGVAKGRLMYLIVLLLAFGLGSGVLSFVNIAGGEMLAALHFGADSMNWILLGVILFCMVLFAGSWAVSVALYRRKEL